MMETSFVSNGITQQTEKTDAPAVELAKRTLDLAGAIVGLMLLSPLFLAIALIIRIDSPGPIFYRGLRLGRGGKLFQILKFRTMYDAPSSFEGLPITARNDGRITPVGRWLRRTKLNELPQLWNVLIGEMSLVGPRPEDPGLAQNWPDTARAEILSVCPGITSPASIQFRNEEELLTVSDALRDYATKIAPEKIRLDRAYVRYRSFSLDLDTLFWTVLTLFPRSGIGQLNDEDIFLGPFSRLNYRFVRWLIPDLLVATVVLGISQYFWPSSGTLEMPVFLLAVFTYSLVFNLIGVVLGVNRIAWSKAKSSDIFELVVTWLAALMIVSGLNIQATVFPVGVVLFASILALIGSAALRFRHRVYSEMTTRARRRFTGPQHGARRVVIVGTGPSAQHAAWMLEHDSNGRNYRVEGFITDEIHEVGSRICGADVIGTVDHAEVILKDRADVVVLTNLRSIANSQALDWCKDTSARVYYLPEIKADNLTPVNAPDVQQRSAASAKNGSPHSILNT